MKIKLFTITLIFLINNATAQPSTFQYMDSCGNIIDDHPQTEKLTPEKNCEADLLARELSINGMGYFGHVGMVGYLNQQKVLEVFQEPKDGIYWHTLSSFKHTPHRPFWGEKFGLRHSPQLEITQANRILKTGDQQRAFPFTYTLSWNWHPGKFIQQRIYDQRTHQWIKVNAVRGAQFRCDSFIFYSYLVGAGLKIFPSFHYPFVPRDMFHAFLTCRDNEGLLCKNTHFIKNQLSPIDINEIEDFIKDNAISRQNKINLIWSQALKYQNDTDKFTYLIDSLSYLKPIELTPDIIKTYQTSDNIKSKLHLINLLIESLQETQHDIAIDHVILAQNFIRKILLNHNHDEILSYLSKVYSSIIPPDQAEQDLNKIKNFLTEKEKNWINLSIAFSNDYYQLHNLPLLLNQKNSSQVCFLLNQLSSDQLNNEIKKTLSHFLIMNQGLLMDHCHWLGAYATTETHSNQEKERYILKFIHNESDPIKQAKWLTQLNYKMISSIPTNEKLYYRDHFLKILNTQSLNQYNPALLYAISALY